MGIERRRFHRQLTVFVVIMLASPVAIPVAARWLGLDSPAVSLMSLFLVLGSMGAICKLAVDREHKRTSRREKRIKSK
ncbi:ECU04_0415 [Encephalitozoon cuniculi GB-M1]|uniref:ECU04_0415 protein n=1 Tax=Encephalitozoon cuniculi (strain GB-M1) TaxID=284813 RepID=I7KFW1_ENCCU|nr:uncharacterized protein ECU04_0415 [Encephalitozoon cuniculi GB-M1]CCI73923.1 ECU04_0415 [Encephalitozoon cuniculi GB-M1]